MSQKIVPSLWYAKEAEEAARFYASVFSESRVDRVMAMAAESPSGPPGSVKVVELTLLGQAFQLMSAGPHHEFNDAVSFTVKCSSRRSIGTGTRSSRTAANRKHAAGSRIAMECAGRSCRRS